MHKYSTETEIQNQLRRFSQWEPLNKEISRFSRIFRSYKGRYLTPSSFINLPHSAFTSINRKIFGIRPILPFIPYGAISEIARNIDATSKVIEIGSGMSTIWLSARAQSVRSLEWDENWHKIVIESLKKRNLTNVDLRLCVGKDELLFNDVRKESIDFVLIDGGPRPECLLRLWEKIRPHGLVYLDNWDSDLFWKEEFDTEVFLLEKHKEIKQLIHVIDYVPTQVAASEGLVIRKN